MAAKRLFGIRTGAHVTNVTHCRKALERKFDPRYIIQVKETNRFWAREYIGGPSREYVQYEVING